MNEPHRTEEFDGEQFQNEPDKAEVIQKQNDPHKAHRLERFSL